MGPFAIVIHLHIFKDLSFGFIPRPEPVAVNQFNLERVKKTLSNGIVPTIAFPAHAANKFILAQDGITPLTKLYRRSPELFSNGSKFQDEHQAL